jgi:hypothetical protein
LEKGKKAFSYITECLFIILEIVDPSTPALYWLCLARWLLFLGSDQQLLEVPYEGSDRLAKML